VFNDHLGPIPLSIIEKELSNNEIFSAWEILNKHFGGNNLNDVIYLKRYLQNLSYVDIATLEICCDMLSDCGMPQRDEDKYLYLESSIKLGHSRLNSYMRTI
jgi:hypothetical protein